MSTEIIISNPATIKAYFEKVRQLATNGDGYPVTIDEVWPLVYARKDHAIRALKKDFLQDVDFQLFPSIGEKGRPEENYKLSVSCLEYFVARKIREVFDVYRAVFHQVIAPQPLSQLDILAQSVAILQQQAKEIQEVKQVQANQGQRLQLLEAKTQTTPDYFTVVGYASLNHMQVGVKQAQQIGQQASQICKAKGLPTDSTPDPRFGRVNMYPREVLQQVFGR